MGHWNAEHLTEGMRSLGWIGYAVGALLVFAQTLLPLIPFIVVAGANVLLFGFWGGFLINYIFSCIGAFTAFLIVRYFGREWVARRLRKYAFIRSFNERLARNGLLYMTLSRVIPVVPSFVINMGSAVMRVRTRHFMIGTLLGKAPMILLESMIGHDLLHFQHNKGRLVVLLLVLAILLLLGHYIKNKWFPGHANHVTIDSKGDGKPHA
ncbi:TVP38/TMEM64 family protein [Paenibacillus sp. GD4]|uniref:TVP38/TMEM64 family protein n=1 Tax=Paenibacillus sp. GD4 TaxID=3068890 RepID=UPI0027965055|nr:TVP38/TMEM64 family protein [Paenibacillus sp. GD4]MDQ1913141.1 TVP38/TMEM64 family protein [Paenibacillus sp. GD4]